MNPTEPQTGGEALRPAAGNVSKSVRLEPSWLRALEREFSAPYMQNLKAFLQKEQSGKKTIYPKPTEYFAALNLTPIDQVKVVIIGQDPYHGPGQAHGLCFSVRPEIPPPPSLENIFKELQSDIGMNRPEHGCLLSWAEQGVLLLNATLSVRASEAGSHQNKGWEEFTDACIDYLAKNRTGLVYLLWGSFAQKKGGKIDKKKNLVLEAPHPSPLSAYRGFLGCRHFSKTNDYLKKNGISPIRWDLPSKSESVEKLKKLAHGTGKNGDA